MSSVRLLVFLRGRKSGTGKIGVFILEELALQRPGVCQSLFNEFYLLLWGCNAALRFFLEGMKNRHKVPKFHCIHDSVGSA